MSLLILPTHFLFFFSSLNAAFPSFGLDVVEGAREKHERSLMRACDVNVEGVVKYKRFKLYFSLFSARGFVLTDVMLTD